MNRARGAARLPGRGLVALIRLYQRTLGAYLPDRCRFEPTCSTYLIEATRRNGVLLGSAQGIWRLLRCGPWTAGGVDHPAPLRPRAHSSRWQDLENRTMRSHG